jgi:large subunit ribosomal protein L15
MPNMKALHTLKRMTKRPYRRVGRGQSSTRGKTSGKGGKGQTARAGAKIRPALRDIIKKIPKRRGYGKNRGRTVWEKKPRPITITLAQLEKMQGAVNPQTLAEVGLIALKKGRTAPAVKLVGASISKKLSVSGVLATAGAKAAIEKAGGTIA